MSLLINDTREKHPEPGLVEINAAVASEVAKYTEVTEILASNG